MMTLAYLFIVAVVIANIGIRNHLDHPCVDQDTRAAIYQEAALDDADERELAMLATALGQRCEE